jgi:hypothetical protein
MGGGVSLVIVASVAAAAAVVFGVGFGLSRPQGAGWGGAWQEMLVGHVRRCARLAKEVRVEVLEMGQGRGWSVGLTVSR